MKPCKIADCPALATDGKDRPVHAAEVEQLEREQAIARREKIAQLYKGRA